MKHSLTADCTLVTLHSSITVTVCLTIYCYFAAAADAPCPVTLFLATVPSRNPFLSTQQANYNWLCKVRTEAYQCKTSSLKTNVVTSDTDACAMREISKDNADSTVFACNSVALT